MMTLYYKPFCPFCERVLEMADNLNVELELKDVSENESIRKELIEKGGKEQTPFLVDNERDVTMYEASDIIDYLREHGAPREDNSEAKRPRVHVSGSVCESCEG